MEENIMRTNFHTFAQQKLTRKLTRFNFFFLLDHFCPEVDHSTSDENFSILTRENAMFLQMFLANEVSK